MIREVNKFIYFQRHIQGKKTLITKAFSFRYQGFFSIVRMNKKQKRNNNFYPFSITSHHVISNYKESKRSELHARITRFSKVVGLRFKRRSRRMLPATEKRRSLEAEVAVRPRTSRATSAKVLAWGHSLSAISRQNERGSWPSSRGEPKYSSTGHRALPRRLFSGDGVSSSSRKANIRRRFVGLFGGVSSPEELALSARSTLNLRSTSRRASVSRSGPRPVFLRDGSRRAATQLSSVLNCWRRSLTSPNLTYTNVT